VVKCSYVDMPGMIDKIESFMWQLFENIEFRFTIMKHLSGLNCYLIKCPFIEEIL